MNMQDFYTGHAFDAYEFFGAHTYFGGTHFAVWAPSAQHIAVETEIGTFDLHRTQSAVWECDAPGVQAGMVYQYWVRGANGQSVAHCDPYGTAMTLRPDGRSIVSDAPKGFADDKWMHERTKCFDKPLNIYEVHAGSWRQKEDGSWYTYAELADLLPAYCKVTAGVIVSGVFASSLSGESSAGKVSSSLGLSPSAKRTSCSVLVFAAVASSALMAWFGAAAVSEVSAGVLFVKAGSAGAVSVSAAGV